MLWNINKDVIDDVGISFPWNNADITNCDFNFNGTQIAICSETDVVVLDLSTSRHLYTLQHENLVLFVLFTSFEDKMITYSTDHMLRVWDIDKQCLLYEFYVIGMNKLVSLTAHPYKNEFAIADGVGCLQLYTILPLKCIYTYNLNRQNINENNIKMKNNDEPVIITKNKHRFLPDELINPPTNQDMVYSPSSASSNDDKLNDNETCMKYIIDHNNIDAMDKDGYLFLISTFGVCQLSLNNLELTYINDPILPPPVDSYSEYDLLKFGVGDVSYDSNNKDITIVVTCGLSPNIFIKKFNLTNKQIEMETNMNLLYDSNEDREIIEQAPITRFQWKLKESPQVSRNKKKSKRKSIIENKSVTFHSKIRSSGYGSINKPNLRWKGGGNKTNNKKKLSNKRLISTSSSSNIWLNNVESKEITTTKLATEYQAHLNRITDVAYSLDGHRLLTTSTDKSGIIYSLRKNSFKTLVQLNGHNAEIKNGMFSNHGENVLTVGADNKLLIWSAENSMKPLITIESNKDILVGKYFHNDKFISMVSGGNFSMYKYRFTNLKKNELIRQVKTGRTNKVYEFNVKSQNITAMNCLNSVRSDIIILSDTQKSIHLLDLNSQKHFLYRNNDAHDRRIINIAMGCEAKNLFSTISIDGIIKVWDARLSGHSVRQFRADNSSILAMSPCGNFIACCKDNQSVLVDIKSGDICMNYGRFPDTISSMAFNSNRLQCCFGYGNGIVRLFE